jgi:hypothetical protein
LAPVEGPGDLSAMDQHRPRFRIHLPHFRSSVSQVSTDLVVALGGALVWRDDFDGDVGCAGYGSLRGVQAPGVVSAQNTYIEPNTVVVCQGEFKANSTSCPSCSPSNPASRGPVSPPSGP